MVSHKSFAVRLTKPLRVLTRTLCLLVLAAVSTTSGPYAQTTDSDVF
jgi:hypothetical protein